VGSSSEERVVFTAAIALLKVQARDVTSDTATFELTVTQVAQRSIAGSPPRLRTSVGADWITPTQR
jgi:hypothetical protein